MFQYLRSIDLYGVLSLCHGGRPMARVAEAPGPIYHPRDPTASPLWKLLDDHYASFRSHYPAVFEKRYGFFRPVVDEVVEDYLACGDLREG